MILIAIFVVLSHEGLIFYLVYLTIPFLFFFKFKNLREIFFHLIPIFLVTLILFFLTYNFHGSEQHVVEICNSVKNYVNSRCESVGQIAALGLLQI